MTSLEATLLADIDAARDELIAFFQGFTRIATPNPPGETREAAAFLRAFLEARGLPYQVIAPVPEWPNIVADHRFERPGRHLVLNGHIDVFPAGDPARWRHGSPWSGTIEDGRLYGRGTADMKCGTSASFIAYSLLAKHRDRLRGRLTLTAVSDEETGGRWGTGFLFANHPDLVMGDCCLNGEPSSAYTVRYGEKAPLWLVFTARARGAHGAYVHLSESATKIAAALIDRLEAVTAVKPEMPGKVARNLAEPSVRQALETGLGVGAADTVAAVTLNIGMVEGGLKTNMIPSECRVEADIRLPVGVPKARIWAMVREIMQDFPSVTVEEQSIPEEEGANWCDPEGEMLHIIQDRATRIAGITPAPVITLAATDARFWRNAGVPAYIYGCAFDLVGTYDESVALEEFLNVVRVHTLSAAAYLGGE
ncbi:M20/M25/M40 family metallo-hydrolase [Elioraea sp.]|uniref:M20/M25/M40 family metallo-hydrolase n=1 Tax=Elioraea sp. TaxID=2185103 RepID=UPI0025C602CD|nr:M20/M25/M40 family metallo-hydrolase [Elioraea sp.]